MDFIAHQAPPSMEFSRQEYWSGLSFSSPGDLPDWGTEAGSSALQADSLPSEPLGRPINLDWQISFQKTGTVDPPSSSIWGNCWSWRKWKKVKLLSCVWLFATPWTAAHQAPLFMGFSRQEYWSGFPFPSPGDLPNSGIEPESPTSQADAFTVWATRESRS